MRFILITILSIFYCHIIYGQIYIDTIKVKKPPKFPRTIYVRSMPVGIYTGAGYRQDRITQNIELGNSFGAIDIGLAYGRTALRKDSAGNGNQYLEGRLTMDVCQYGKFSNEMTIGAGYVFNAQNNLMLELSYTIYAQIWERVGMGLTTTYYDFSGNKTDIQHNMFGLYLRYGLGRNDSGLLKGIKIVGRSHPMGHH